MLLFLGAGITRAGDRSLLDDLTAQLVARGGLDPAATSSFPDVAQTYEDDRSRNALIQFVRDRVEGLGDAPQTTHRLIAQLTTCTILTTTCFDHLLERAFAAAGHPPLSVIGDSDVAFSDERKTLLYKLHGAID